ncbi:MAG: hypothetical protein M1831_004905 [Alyxoria varia]|nr:MAG: hypothetical protein M1831_004905 [Alyxoria varia]
MTNMPWTDDKNVDTSWFDPVDHVGTFRLPKRLLQYFSSRFDRELSKTPPLKEIDVTASSILVALPGLFERIATWLYTGELKCEFNSDDERPGHQARPTRHSEAYYEEMRAQLNGSLLALSDLWEIWLFAREWGIPAAMNDAISLFHRCALTWEYHWYQALRLQPDQIVKFYEHSPRGSGFQRMLVEFVVLHPAYSQEWILDTTDEWPQVLKADLLDRWADLMVESMVGAPIMSFENRWRVLDLCNYHEHETS